MKAKTLSAIFTNALLCFLLSYGGVACFATAFELEIPFSTLVLWCAVAAFAGCVAASFPKGGWILLTLLAFPTYYLLKQTDLRDQIIHLCYHVSRLYNSAYGCGWLGQPMDVETVTLPLYVWGSLNALICSGCITRGRFTPVAVLFPLLPLVLCLVITNTVPGVGPLFLLLAGLILTLLTQNIRRRDACQGVSLTWMLAIPVMLALLLLFLVNPQISYNRQHYADDLGDALLRLADRLPYVEIDDRGVLQFDTVRHIPDTVSLSSKGPNNQLPIPVMEVTAEVTGPVYLRGRDYDQYDGAGWTATEDRAESFTALQPGSVIAYGIPPQAMGQLTVKTSGSQSSRYLPYYPDTHCPLDGGACNNPSAETSYTYNWYALPEDFETKISDSTYTDYAVTSSFSSGTVPISGDILFYYHAVPGSLYANYVELPDDTLLWADAYLKAQLPQLYEMESICDLANAIAGLVRRSAEYDLNTPRMPEDATDFARWFLEESDTGYCVHYATATTVLLRAAGIPARYVEGYLADTRAGRTVTVTERDAHAWAEYFVQGIGWIPLESTAGGQYSDPFPVPPSAVSDPMEDTTAEPTATESPTDPAEDTAIPSDTTQASINETTAPAASGSDSDLTDPTVSTKPAQTDEKEPVAVNKPAVASLCLLLLLALQYPVRLRLREEQLRSGTPNQRAVKYWRFSRQLASLSHQPLPDELDELALRAKFSQHTLTADDLNAFKAFRTETIRTLKDCPWWKRLYHRFIWAAY